MAINTPNVSSSQALIPVGWPLVSVAKSNPVSGAPAPVPQNPTGAAASTAQQTAINQAGDQNNTSV